MAVTSSASTSAAAAAFTYLIPAQIPGAKHKVVKKKVVKSRSSSESCSAVALRSDDDEEGLIISSLTTATEENGGQQQQQPAVPSSSSSATTTSSSSINSSQSKRRRRYKPRRHQRTGNLPDVHWRSIPMSHLRCHPNFQPLPPPSQITSIPTKEHVRHFRQDSWQWDYLHRGRCTTSQTAAALGFLESKAAHYLGIPNSLRRGGYGAWERLREHVPDELYDDLKALECVLCEGRATDDIVNNEGNNSATTSTSLTTTTSDTKVSTWRPGAKETERLWISSQQLRQRRSIHNITESSTSSTSHYRRKPFPFVAKYIPNLSTEELYQRKLVIQHYEQSPSPMATRMRWGNAQEATSILTALNYFCKEDEKTIIREVGMCGCAFDRDVKKYNNGNDDSGNKEVGGGGDDDDLLQGLSIGATPDALVCHGDGTVEVLEVKNHCPFVWNKISPHYTQKNHGGSGSGGGGNRRNGNSSNKSSNKKKKHKMKGNRHRHQNNRRLNDDIADNYGEGGGDHHKPSAATRKKENGDNNNNNNRLPKHYLIRDFHLEQRIPPVYIPQLMMEILCVGDEIDLKNDNDEVNNKQQHQSKKPICKSAIMVRQTATKGAILLRLNRDEEWITEMKYWLGKFKKEFVDEGIIPEDNFFWDTGGERYQKFLQRTKELSESVEFVAFIEHGNIQRVVFEHGVKGEIPLFLDNVEKAD